MLCSELISPCDNLEETNGSKLKGTPSEPENGTTTLKSETEYSSKSEETKLSNGGVSTNGNYVTTTVDTHTLPHIHPPASLRPLEEEELLPPTYESSKPVVHDDGSINPETLEDGSTMPDMLTSGADD